MTHTLEVSSLSRTVARGLGLNEDLVEAIALGHDIGHAPFGHAGEHALDAILRERYERRFHHAEHGVRVVEVLEREGEGLNLTRQVVDGIRNHSGSGRPSTAEGEVVRIVDRIAYINHDIEDAVRAGALDVAELPAREIAILGESGSERLTTLLEDMVATSGRGEGIAQSRQIGQAFLRLRKFMFDRVYLGPAARGEAERAGRVVRALFEWFLAHPDELPDSTDDDPIARVADHVAGMTDRYAMRLYRSTFMPTEGLL